jgi:hypothetical protein
MVQGHHRADALGDFGSVRPAAAAQSSSWLSHIFSRSASGRTAAQQPQAVNGASLPPGTKAPTDKATGAAAAQDRPVRRFAGGRRLVALPRQDRQLCRDDDPINNAGP